MTTTHPRAEHHVATPEPAVRLFHWSWILFLVSAALGAVLRLQVFWTWERFNYGYWVHAHSHLAFLGWVYNAFFALAVRYFAPGSETPRYVRLFWITQIATLGMLVSFPVQGYGPVSIVFSTLHLGCSAVFAWKLLRRNRAAPIAARYLRWAFVCLFASAIGPFALGPLAAAGLRETPWYPLSIYTYLHFQYNGWFVLFLLAVGWQWAYERQRQAALEGARRALPYLLVGILLTLALSALWLNPPRWVFALAIAGGVAQLVASVLLLRTVRWLALTDERAGLRNPRATIVRLLVLVALGMLLLKFALQAVGAWPWTADLANQRPVVIAFLHLVFLGFVTPLLLAKALTLGWGSVGKLSIVGLAVMGLGVFLTEAVLLYLPLAGLLQGPAWPWFSETLLVAAGCILLGAFLLTPCLLRPTWARSVPGQ